MADEGSAPAPRRRRSIVLGVVAALLILLAAVVALLPRLAAPVIQREISAALQAPVAIETLSWNPLAGRLEADGITIGEGDDQLKARRLTVDVELSTLSRNYIAVENAVLEAPVGALRFDEDYNPVLPFGGGGGHGGGAAPTVQVRNLTATDGALSLRHPAGGTMRQAQIEIARFNATDFAIAPTKSGALGFDMAGMLEGKLDGAPLNGELQVHLAGDEQKITAKLAVAGMAASGDSLPLPAELASFTAKLDAKAELDVASAAPAHSQMKIDLRLADVALSGDADTAFTAKTVSMPALRIDFAQSSVDLGAMTIDKPVVTIAVEGNRVVLPLPISAAESSVSSSWTVTTGKMQAGGGQIRARNGDATAAVALDSFRFDGLRPKRAGALAVKAKVDGGGTIAIEGTVAPDPLEAKLDVALTAASLPPFAAIVEALPLKLAEGEVDGKLSLLYRDGLQELKGQLQVSHLHTLPPDPAHPADVLAVHQAESAFSLEPGDPPTLDFTAVKLSYAYAMVRRGEGRTFPYYIFFPQPDEEALQAKAFTPQVGALTPGVAVTAGAPAEATPANAATPVAQAGVPVRVRLRQVEIEGGKIEFLDDTLAPPFWTTLTDIAATATEVLYPDETVEHFNIEAKQDELSPIKMAGSLTARGLDAQVDAQDVMLGSLNPYVAPVLGYRITSGRFSTSATTAPAPPLLESTAVIVLRGVDVLQTGRDVIQEQSGVPLPIALGLIANTAGEIRLTLPFFVDTQARRVSLGSVVWQAVRSAIVGALTSPLRLLGSLFGTKGAPHAFAVDPIPFAVGSGALDSRGEKRVEQIARILAAHQGLVLVLMPQVTAADGKAVGGDGAVLAEKRSAAVRDAFTKGAAPLPAKRLLMVPWKPSAGAEATGEPGVYVELQDAE